MIHLAQRAFAYLMLAILTVFSLGAVFTLQALTIAMGSCRFQSSCRS